MANDPCNINMDDIFSALPPVEPFVPSAPPSEDKRRSVISVGSRVSTNDHDSHHSHHTDHHSSVHTSVLSSHPQSTIISEHSIPPEPKSRASTARSQTSSVSTLVGVPAPHSHPAPVAAPRAEPAPATGDVLLDSIFGAVTLPTVNYVSEDDSHHHAIQHLEDALAGEETDGHHDDYSINSGRSSRQSIAPSHHSHAPSHHSAVRSHHSQAQSRHSISPSHVSTATKTSVGSAPNHVAESLVKHSFEELELNGHVHSNGYHDVHDHYAEEPHIPAVDYDDEAHDQFEPAHLPSIAKDHHMRPRTMTMDSMVSQAETRYGGFDVHDENGTPSGDQIDLYHNEVAYKRPKKKHSSKSVPLPAMSPIPSGGTLKLSQLNREVAEARQKQALLTAQVEREKAEVERLKLLKQQDLARAAAAKVGRPASVSRTESVGSVSSYVSSYHKPSSVSGRAAPSSDSIYEEEPAKISEVAHHQYQNGQVVGQVGKLSLVVPHMEVVEGFSKNDKIHKVYIGGKAPSTEDDKTVLLFGPVGSGKTSAINSMLNYLFDVKKENNFRFVLDASEPKKTTGLTAYVINNSILPFSVTIIDTPGVVNQQGNQTVSTLIKTWFEQELLDAGAFRLDAISIVLSHDEDNLGWPFIYELAAVKKMFGDDLKTNVLPIITNCEVLPQPIAIRSLALANIAFVEYYKVNNLGFQPDAKGVSKLQHNLFFSHGIGSLEQFFRDLQELIHPLLAVLRGGAAKRAVASHSFDRNALY